LWIDLLIRWLMTSEVGSEIGRQQTWIIADEVASLGYSPQIESSLLAAASATLLLCSGCKMLVNSETSMVSRGASP
jgi:hypothetical protein